LHLPTPSEAFYTNNHEKYAHDRVEYVWAYFHDYEPYFPYFVKMPLGTVTYLKVEGRLDQDYEGTGFKRNGEEWRQFYVDCCKDFWDYLYKTPLEDRYREELGPDDPRIGHESV
jgi:hypothetical protein